MSAWQLDNDYDRPIPRRLLEERGVPRAWFGFGKKAVAQDFESPVGARLRDIFFDQSGWSPRQESLYRLLHFVSLHGDRDRLLELARRNDKRALATLRDLHRETFLLCTALLAAHFERPVPGEAPAPWRGAAERRAAAGAR
jgi:hypothetical protein